MSSFAWLDFQDSDRQKALDVIDLFRDKGTVDELGVGTVRDAIADILFPGTSTIMTRARYYLFIPWIYKDLEKKQIPSTEIARRARNEEITLINALAAGGEELGVIGIDARSNLKRLPSTIYWQGLGQLGFRLFPGSRDHYHSSLTSYYKFLERIKEEGEAPFLESRPLDNWDPGLPPAPAGLMDKASLLLDEHEARYFSERVLSSAPQSLFAFMVDNLIDCTGIDYPWWHPLYADMSESNKAELSHARNFSQTMVGAAYLYNFLLAEKRKDEEILEGYKEAIEDWAKEIQSREGELRSWSIDAFWRLIEMNGARVGQGTKAFIDQWIGLTRSGSAADIIGDGNARNLVALRERSLKGELSRLENQRALELWGGASSSGMMDYRWNKPVKAILSDLLAAGGKL